MEERKMPCALTTTRSGGVRRLEFSMFGISFGSEKLNDAMKRELGKRKRLKIKINARAHGENCWGSLEYEIWGNFP
jgi:hypothetical protein